MLMVSILADNEIKSIAQNERPRVFNAHMNIKENFAKRLREALIETSPDGKQGDWAKLLGCSNAQMSDMLNAKKLPSTEHLIEYCLILDVCVEWMATGRGHKKPPCDKQQEPLLTKEQKEMLKKITDLVCV